MSDEVNYQNSNLSEALDFTEQFKVTNHVGYVKPVLRTPRLADKAIIQQNNLLIAFIVTLHLKVTKLEIELQRLSHLYSRQENSQALEKLSTDLSKLSLGKRTIKTPIMSNRFLTFNKDQFKS